MRILPFHLEILSSFQKYHPPSHLANLQPWAIDGCSWTHFVWTRVTAWLNFTSGSYSISSWSLPEDAYIIVKIGYLILLTALEVCVAEALLVRIISSLVEIVHVQLSDEWRKIVVLKKSWEYPLSEFIRLFNDKAVTNLIPTYYVVQCRILHTRLLPHQQPYIYYVICLYQEWWHSDQCGSRDLILTLCIFHTLRHLRIRHGLPGALFFLWAILGRILRWFRLIAQVHTLPKLYRY